MPDLNENYKDAKDLGLPDLNDADLSRFARPAAEPVAEVVQESSEAADGDGTDIGQDRDVVNPHARVRILEKERDAERRDQQILANRLQMLMEKLPEIVQNARQESPTPTPEIKIEDEDLDPLTVILKTQKKLLDEVGELKQKQNVTTQITQDQQALNTADTLMAKAMNESPEFNAAVGHLAQIILSDLDDKFPNHTQAEKLRLADQAIQREKIEFIKRGRNPVAEFYKRASIMGFRYEKPTIQQDQAREIKNEKAASKDGNPKDQIQREKDKQSSMSSIGGSSNGAPARKLDIKALANMSEADFNRTIDEAVKAGQFVLKPGQRTPSIGQLLSGLENKRR